MSTKSKKVYERRLILKYIKENGTDPITGDKLEESDLITIEASKSIFDALLSTSFKLIKFIFRSGNSAASSAYPYFDPGASSFPSK